ncbi:MAG: BON domain-containing protein, partial [Gammaproteobacteria bacterium]|nr:BON domain-containing protein [Gammaproteobacteria bacterium]
MSSGAYTGFKGLGIPAPERCATLVVVPLETAFARGVALALAVALCVFVGCSTTQPRPADAATQRVQDALATDQRLAGREFKVSVEHGVAHLRGWVQSTHDLLVVQGDVLSVPGI